MGLQFAESKSAQEAFTLVRDLQSLLVNKLESLPSKDPIAPLRRVDWLRAQGNYGGGSRYVATDERLFNRASVNISQVQYEKDPSKKLGSATAISSIVHPRNPFVPSVHIHVSWTEMKSGEGYWRIMGDLNPSLPSEVDKQKFLDAFHAVVPETLYRYGTQQGDRYFNIPALGRHRGVAHFYLEEYRSEKREADQQFARDFGIKVIETYADIVQNILKNEPKVSADDWRKQLDYHTLYFLQVLTLDRGTTSGLLVHDENDTGILGSLPSHVDKVLLRSWLPKLPELQRELVEHILVALADGEKSLVDDQTKREIAQSTRQFYKKHPEAQDLLARGDRIPPTQENHLQAPS